MSERDEVVTFLSRRARGYAEQSEILKADRQRALSKQYRYFSDVLHHYARFIAEGSHVEDNATEARRTIPVGIPTVGASE